MHELPLLVNIAALGAALVGGVLARLPGGAAPCYLPSLGEGLDQGAP